VSLSETKGGRHSLAVYIVIRGGNNVFPFPTEIIIYQPYLERHYMITNMAYKTPYQASAQIIEAFIKNAIITWAYKTRTSQD